MDPVIAPSADGDLVDRLRHGDSAAFTDLVRAWSPAMLHVARSCVASQASAEEAVQETWLALIRGIDRFEGRSSLRTWVFHTLLNIARRQGVRERRAVPVADPEVQNAAPTVDPRRFRPAGEQWAGGWRADAAPRAWGPEAAALSGEVRALIADALARLPDRQRVVVQLRDVDGVPAEEICDLLNLTAANQRVLLHRGRAALRQHLEDYYHPREEETQ
ncbi:RNA polymerase sigma factor [Nakamurella lactea]|uniref:RNA polymerase sigma factor n=1 Tax=Nakamurella lactea TaxID=459515 RepID=UPI0004053D81|nr:sigma-70 family RNA polymerase sigma factor [Nakamurella lactea]